MDTTYYSFETKKIKVSGGADMLAVVPAPVPAPASPAGEVLDFALCRRRLETKAAWKGLAQAVESVKTPEGFDGDQVYEAVTPAPAAKASETAPAAARPLAGKAIPAVKAPKATKAPNAIPARLPSLVVKLRRAAQAVRMSRAGGWLELCASLAVILVCVWAGWGFLALV